MTTQLNLILYDSALHSTLNMVLFVTMDLKPFSGELDSDREGQLLPTFPISPYAV